MARGAIRRSRRNPVKFGLIVALALGSSIGVIGGGQLGRMLAMAAARLGYQTVILDPQRDCPAAQVANRHIVAAYDDLAAIAEMVTVCAIVTYEFENVPVGTAQAIAASIPVYPPPQALEAAQDRVAEKTFLNDIGIPTAEFRTIDSDADLAAGLADFDGSGVLKTRRLGYDGKGQHVFRGKGDDPAGAYAEMGRVPLILESLIAFEREISVIAVRGLDGALSAFDPVQNVHRGGILHTSTVPAAIASDTATAALAAALKILKALDYVGVIGVEFFVTPGGDLVANEIAPRVHNSGHWTEAACVVSQFEQHIRAICGLPLGSPSRHSDCVMENLIGDDVMRVAELMAEADLCLHLYGKAEARPGRKMGHFTRLKPLGRA